MHCIDKKAIAWEASKITTTNCYYTTILACAHLSLGPKVLLYGTAMTNEIEIALWNCTFRNSFSVVLPKNINNEHLDLQERKNIIAYCVRQINKVTCFMKKLLRRRQFAPYVKTFPVTTNNFLLNVSKRTTNKNAFQ